MVHRPTDPARTLLCVPTPGERARLTALAPDVASADRWLAVETVGFGPVAAAARAGQLVERHRPDRVVLAGIAGAYPNGPLVGTAAWFGAVVLDGVGAGEGAAHSLPGAMGLAQWEEEDDGAVHEHLPLEGDGPLLLTACAATDGPGMLAARRARFPDAAAEDMEAFGVALAGRLARVPVQVVRGISNVVGDRRRASWRIDDALVAVAELLRAALDDREDAR